MFLLCLNIIKSFNLSQSNRNIFSCTLINPHVNINPRKGVHMKIKEYLEDKGLSAAKVAKKLGISRSYFNTIINERRVPSLHLARKIEAFCDGRVKAVEILKLK